MWFFLRGNLRGAEKIPQKLIKKHHVQSNENIFSDKGNIFEWTMKYFSIERMFVAVVIKGSSTKKENFFICLLLLIKEIFLNKNQISFS